MKGFEKMLARNPDKAEEINPTALRFTLIAETDSLRCPSNLAVG
jgi:hypothetical protein